MRNSLIIVLFFIVGVIMAYRGVIPEFLVANDYSMYVLYILMFLVGVSIGSDLESLKVLYKEGFRIVFVPTAIIMGTLAGSAIISVLLPELSFRESMAVGSGFGYYSLSSIFISQIHSEELGVIALIANISREIITLLLAPIMVIYSGKLAPIASGGATSMDTTLPIIVRYSGKEYAVIAIFSGVLLTLLVPFLVTFILTI
jgi:uncharacterized membrane protein YbjE (DUF340 family)